MCLHITALRSLIDTSRSQCGLSGYKAALVFKDTPAYVCYIIYICIWLRALLRQHFCVPICHKPQESRHFTSCLVLRPIIQIFFKGFPLSIKCIRGYISLPILFFLVPRNFEVIFLCLKKRSCWKHFHLDV